MLCRLLAALLAVVASVGAASADAPLPRPGEPFDAAPFADAIREPDGKAVVLRWADPRKIRRLVVDFGDAAAPPPPEALRLQYWHRVWKGGPDPVLLEQNAGGVGWDAVDDWTNGAWRDADVRTEADGVRRTFAFAPTGEKEFPKLGAPGVAYRRTLQIRLSSTQALPPGTRLAAFTDAVCRPLTARIFLGAPADPGVRIEGGDTGRIEVFNGAVAAVRPLAGARAGADGPGSWTLDGIAGGLEADLVLAVDPVDARYDRTVVTVRSRQRPFSFAADEVARGDRILVDAFGALVVRGDDTATLEEARLARREFAGRTIYRRVFDEPEQSLARAWDAMPLKRPLWFVHGLPGNRNTFRQEPNGEIGVAPGRHWFRVPPSAKDTNRRHWAGDLKITFGLPDGGRRGGRELLQGYIPRLRTWWQDGPLQYEQTTFLDTLDPAVEPASAALDDPTVLWVRLRVVNTTAAEAGTARLLIASHAGGRREAVRLEDDRLVAGEPDSPVCRTLLRAGGRGATATAEDGVAWTLDLPPGAAQDLYILIPSVTPSADEVGALRKRDFDADGARLAAFWEALTARGTRLDTPEPWLNDFYKAHARHLLVNCFKETGSDRLHAHVGSFAYGVYPDESAMMISDLDRRGYHREAERCLESFLHYQGTMMMPGNFKSKEGLFYGSGGHDTGGYNKSHGWVMWLMAEHWRLTRDRAWLERAAPKLVASCDWVGRERQATQVPAPDGSRSIEHGFLPSGSLEDVTDYWHWLVTNACTVWGFEALAEALADAGHPEAPRLKAEAAAFRADVMRGLTEARDRSPVVRLRDGTYVPHYPSSLHARGRSHGWLRETLEGAIHLPITGLLAPDAPETRWIVDDFEDNLYISDTYGYAIPAFDHFWFSRGGFSMQANLLGGPLVYLDRDEPKHYIRAVLNGFASAFYPEIRMCNEHSLPELGYPAGDHYKSSDEAQATYWLRLMFVNDRGRDLILGQAVPRAWLADGRSIGLEGAATAFGPVSVRYTSRAAQGELAARVTLSGRNPPARVRVRLRHPDGAKIRSVTVNGTAWDRFDAEKEWVELPGNTRGAQEVVARY